MVCVGENPMEGREGEDPDLVVLFGCEAGRKAGDTAPAAIHVSMRQKDVSRDSIGYPTVRLSCVLWMAR